MVLRSRCSVVGAINRYSGYEAVLVGLREWAEGLCGDCEGGEGGMGWSQRSCLSALGGWEEK